jgi:alpha-amylase
MTHRIHYMAIALMSLAAGACGMSTSDPVGDPARAGALAEAERDTFVHLFEWSWVDIARECEEFLGPRGYAAVQISPPSEHIAHDAWWARYQPVSYQLESRGGTREELIDMVERCAAAGVAIYADMVINHTASLDGSGVGVAGSAWSYKNHPAIGYRPEHYHAPCAITNYADAFNVQSCELVGLPDLRTGDAFVQERIAAYMKDLLDLGVAGFRIDAAKHIAARQLEEILARAGDPPVFLEVIGAYGEAVKPEWYAGLGKVTEFGYSRDMGAAFLGGGKLADLRHIGEGKLDSGVAVVFTDNHDNQRGHGAGGEPVTFQDGARYSLANAFMLAWPYGYPQVMSSYRFEDTDQGPPAGGGGCEQTGRVCEHRFTAIASMVEFRRVTAGEPVINWWDEGDHRVAFGRGDKGFVAINDTGEPMREILQTGLPAGIYCDIGSAELGAGGCTGATVSVDMSGLATIEAGAYAVSAVHAGTRIADAQGNVMAGRGAQ